MAVDSRNKQGAATQGSKLKDGQQIQSDNNLSDLKRQQADIVGSSKKENQHSSGKQRFDRYQWMGDL